VRIASWPSWVNGWRTADSGGLAIAATSVSSNDMTERSSGTATRRCRAASSTPSAWASLAAKIAVGRGSALSRISPAASSPSA
jgi:hypothetical protein